MICTSGNMGGVDALISNDIVSRYFAPWVGINEDPVTGACNFCLHSCTDSLSKGPLIPFLAHIGGNERQLREESKKLLRSKLIRAVEEFFG